MTDYRDIINDFGSTDDFISNVDGFKAIIQNYIVMYKEKKINEDSSLDREIQNMLAINKQIRTLSCIISFLLSDKYHNLDTIQIKKTNDDLFQELRNTQMLFMNRLILKIKNT
jgi:hypothetical protein